jgi:stage II sporulation protein E
MRLIKMESVASRDKRVLNIDKEEALVALLGFLISRVSISGKMMPFGVGFLAAYLLVKGKSLLLLLAISLGSLSLTGLKGVDYILTAGIIYMVFLRVNEAKESTLLKASIMSSLIFLFVRAFKSFLWGQLYMYDLFTLSFEALLVFTMAYIFSFSLPLEEIKSKGLSNEKLICSFITLALVLSGLNNIWFFGLNLKNILSLVVIVYMGYKEGVLFGAVSGTVLGLITYIGSPEMPFIVAILTVGGLLSGLFRELGRAGSLLGFILGNGIISFYINNFVTSFLDYRDLLVGSLAFLILTQFVKYDLTHMLSHADPVEREHDRRKEEFILKKLDKVSDIFVSLSKILDKAIEEDESYSAMDVYNLVDEVSNTTCRTCSNYKSCWEDNYYTSYYRLLNLIGLMEEGKADKEALLPSLKGICIKGEDLINNVNSILQPLKTNQLWNKRLNEQRRLLADQLYDFGFLIKDIGNDIYARPEFNQELEVLLLKEIKNRRMDIKDLSVLVLPGDELEILVEMYKPLEEVKELERLRLILSKALGYGISADYGLGNSLASKIISFRKANRFASLTDVSSLANSENKVSGDSYSFGERGNVNFAAICDGMGIGKKANRESGIAIELLEKLMEINMDRPMIIRTINSFLRAKSNDEIFTTLDLSFIDLYTGKLQVIKNGSPPTFIKRKDRVDIISSKSLPIGILENVDSNIYEDSLEDGDILIMMSDGVLDSNSTELNPEEWMMEIIRDIDSQNPKKITEEILNRANLAGQNQPKDDMTIMATKIWRTI